MEYTIVFINNKDGILGSVSGITGNIYCTNGYDNAASIIVWAAHEGIPGYKSDQKFLATVVKSTTSRANTKSTPTAQEGAKIFKCIHTFNVIQFLKFFILYATIVVFFRIFVKRVLLDVFFHILTYTFNYLYV